jgi:transposase
MAGLKVRDDVSAEDLRQLAKGQSDARVTRRLLALANALDGMEREMAARLAGMDRQTLRDWVIRYNKGGLAALGAMAGPAGWTKVSRRC